MISIILLNSSLLKSVEIKTSCAVLPFLAIALYPFMVFTDNLIINFEDLPRTLDIEAGVIVFILMLRASFWSIGIRPSIFVLWFNTNLPNFSFMNIIFTKYCFWVIKFSLKLIKKLEVLLYLIK